MLIGRRHSQETRPAPTGLCIGCGETPGAIPGCIAHCGKHRQRSTFGIETDRIESFFARDEEDETSLRQNEPSSDGIPESVLAAKEIAGVVNSAMDELPEELRQAVVLGKLKRLSYEEISLAMAFLSTIGTVRSRIFQHEKRYRPRSSPG